MKTTAQSQLDEQARLLFYQQKGSYPEENGFNYAIKLGNDKILYTPTSTEADAFIKEQFLLTKMSNKITIIMMFVIAPLLIIYMLATSRVWAIALTIAIMVCSAFWLSNIGKKCKQLEDIHQNKLEVLTSKQ